MADMVSCPTCHVMLRVPPTAEMIRCPQCKTVVAIQPAVAPPPPPPVKKAIPLPFGAPPVAPPPPPPPEPPPTAKTVTRAKALPEYEEIDEDDDNDDASPERRKRTRPTDDDERLVRQLKQVTKPARTGIQLLAFGSVCAAVNALAVFGIFFLSLFKLSLGGWFWLPALPLVVQWLLTFAGFAFCCGGPKLMRSMAVIGVFIQTLQVIVWVALSRMMVQHIAIDAIGFNGVQKEELFASNILYSIVFNNLVGIINMPMLIHLSPDIVTRAGYVLILFAAGVEFARICVVGMLANHYAVQGKAPEIGFQSMRFVYRMFGVMLFGAVAQVIAVMMYKLGFGTMFALLPSLMVMNAYMMWALFSWGAQYQTLMDVAEMIEAKRFADKRSRLEGY